MFLLSVGDPYKYHQDVTNAAWKGKSAGGCGNHPETYANNPRFQFKADSDCQMLIELKGPKEFQIGFDVICVIANDAKSPYYFKRKSSGSYRSGFVVKAFELTAGTYDVVPSTFHPGQHHGEAVSFFPMTQIIPHQVSALQNVNLFSPWFTKKNIQQ